MQRLAYANKTIILDPEGRIADEAVSNEVIGMAKEMAFCASEKYYSTRASINTGLGPSSVPSIEEAPTDVDRRTGDTAVYKYYIQTVHPLNASIFLAACSLFVVGLTIPRKCPRPGSWSPTDKSFLQNSWSNGGWMAMIST